MSGLARERCLYHADREAAARCPVCRQYFCRECVTEHEDRVICATCLRRLTASAAVARGRLALALRTLAGLVALVLCWLCFYGLGQLLLRVPASYHDGAIWGGGEEAEP